MSTPNGNGVCEPLVPVVLAGSPQVHLGTDALDVRREDRDVVILVFAVVQRHWVRIGSPLDSKGIPPHCTGVLVSDAGWNHE
jgi:hypothetical protein